MSGYKEIKRYNNKIDPEDGTEATTRMLRSLRKRGQRGRKCFVPNAADAVNKASVSFVIFFLTTSVNLSLQNTLDNTTESGGCISLFRADVDDVRQ